MTRATITVLAAVAAAVIVAVALAAALSSAAATGPTTPVEPAYSAPTEQTPAMTEFVFWEAWDQMDDGEQFAVCLEVWELGTRDAAAYINDASTEFDYHLPTLTQVLGDACN